MKYWLFQNNQVVGPHDRSELVTIPGFGAESLVCPEGRKGTQMGDWQRAGVVSELAEVLLKISKVPAGVLAGGGQGLLPPEPTLRDLAVLGSLQEKLTLLESVISQLQDDLRGRTQELAQVKVDYELKARESELLKAKLDEVEKRLAQTELLKEEVAKTQVQGAALAQTQASQAAEIEKVSKGLEMAQEELQKQLEEVRRRAVESEEKIFRVEHSAAPSPAVAPPPAPFAPPAAAPAFGPAPSPAPAFSPAPAPAFAAPPAPVEPEPRLEPPPMDFMPGASAAPGTMPYQGEMGGPAPLDLPALGSAEPQPLVGFAEVGSPQAPAEAAPMARPRSPAAEGVADLSAAPAKKKGKGGTIAVIVLLAASAAAGAGHYLGLFDSLLGKKAPAVPPAPQASVPMEPPKTATPETVKTGMADKSQAAVDFVKSYAAPGGAQTLSERLEGPNPAPGLAPWMVEHVADDRYTVSYYDRASDSKSPRYRFDVRLDMRTLEGADTASKALLKGGSGGPPSLMMPAAPAPSPAATEKPKHRKRHPAKAAQAAEAAPKEAAPKEDSDLVGSMLSEPSRGEEALSEQPAQSAKQRKEKKTAEPAQAAQGTPADEQEAQPAEPAKTEAAAPARAAKKGGKSAKKPKEDMSLDDLLLPGVPKEQ